MVLDDKNDATVLSDIISFADRLSSFAKTTLNRELEKHGLKFNQWRLLHIIYTKAIYTPAKIADELMIERATVSRYLDQLEEIKCIVRTHNRLDRRVVDISLTEKGEKLAKLGIDLMNDAYNDTFPGLSSSDNKELSLLIQKITRGFHSSLQE